MVVVLAGEAFEHRGSAKRVRREVFVRETAEMPENPVRLTAGVPETILPETPDDFCAALAKATEESDVDARRTAVAGVVVRWPRVVDGWVALGVLGRDPIERYAAFRVGYHRGLDTLRANGWKGSGYVRWSHETNRGFLRAVEGLREMAAQISETDEAERCELFLRQLDPAWTHERHE